MITPTESVCEHSFIKSTDMDVGGYNAPFDDYDVGMCRKCGFRSDSESNEPTARHQPTDTLEALDIEKAAEAYVTRFLDGKMGTTAPTKFQLCQLVLLGMNHAQTIADERTKQLRADLAVEKEKLEAAEKKIELDTQFFLGMLALIRPILKEDSDFRKRVQTLAAKYRVAEAYPVQADDKEERG